MIHLTARLAALGLLLILAPLAWSQGGYLGVQIDQQHEGKGVKLSRVMPDTAAAAAGLKDGDVITGINGKAINGYQGLVYTLREMKPGDELKIQLLRGDKTLNKTAKLGKAPRRPRRPGRRRPRAPKGAKPDLGITFVGNSLRIKTAAGSATKVGLRTGDTVLQFDWQPVKTRAAFDKKLAAKRPYSSALLAVTRDKQLLIFKVDVGFKTDPSAARAAAALLRLPKTAPAKIAWGAALEAGLALAKQQGRNVMVEVWGKG